MNDGTQLIDMSDYLSLFKDYLDGNSRCMLSAQFGEGKSTFLNAFCEVNKEEYCFIKLYPINYQVSRSEDVFKMIKYDILLQLMGMVDLDDVVPQGSVIWGFLKENFFDLSIDLVKGLSSIPGAVVIGKPVELLLTNLKKYRDYSDRKGNETQKGVTDAFINEVTSSGGVFEFDGVTMLIIVLLRKYKEEMKKKMVMIVEDLDRLDPGQIFRILNVLSANSDTSNSEGMLHNKFGFDKVVLVCDYENIKSVYSHFYGEKTDFEGYISKYMSAPAFKYTLKDKLRDYIVKKEFAFSEYPDLVKALAGIVVAKYMSDDSLKLRDVCEKWAVNYKGLIREEMIPVNGGAALYISSINDLSKLLLFLRVFHVSLKEFRDAINGNAVRDFYKLIGEAWLMNSELPFFMKYENGMLTFHKPNFSNGSFSYVSFNSTGNIISGFNKFDDQLYGFLTYTKIDGNLPEILINPICHRLEAFLMV